MHVIVTAFFDIGRHNWNSRFHRPKETYFENAEKVLQTPEDMIIFVEEGLKDWVVSKRDSSRFTKVVTMRYEELKYASHEQRIEEIMRSDSFRENLQNSDVPEYNIAQYNVVTWSKLSLVEKASELCPEYTHLAWVDFGLHTYIIPEVGKPFYPQGIPDKIRVHCREKTHEKDYDLAAFCKSAENRFAAGSITGSKNNIKILSRLFDEEVKNLTDQGLTHCEQFLISLVYQKHPDLFSISYGDWGQIFSNYYGVKYNQQYVLEYCGIEKDVIG